MTFATRSGSSHIGKWFPPATTICRTSGNRCFHCGWNPRGSLRSPKTVATGSVRKWPAEHAIDFCVQGRLLACVVEVRMKRPCGSPIDAREKHVAVGPSHETPDTECGRRDFRQETGPSVEFPDGGAAHQRQHASERCARWFPPKGVHHTQRANAVRDGGGARDTRWSAEIVDDECDVPQIEPFDHRGQRTR